MAHARALEAAGNSCSSEKEDTSLARAWYILMACSQKRKLSWRQQGKREGGRHRSQDY